LLKRIHWEMRFPNHAFGRHLRYKLFKKIAK
jgi:hypothetical protein